MRLAPDPSPGGSSRCLERALQTRFEAKQEAIERRGRIVSEKHGDVDIAPLARSAAGHAAEQVDRDDVGRVSVEELAEPRLDLFPTSARSDHTARPAARRKQSCVPLVSVPVVMRPWAAMGIDATGEDAIGSNEARRASRIGGVTLIVLCQSMQALAYGGIALFLPLIRTELGLSFTQAGVLAAASTVVYAVMQIPSGFLADRVGARRLFLVGVLGTSLLVGSFARLHDYGALVANQALAGGFRSLLFAPGLLLISALFPPERRATAMGLYVAGGFASNVFLNLLGPSLVGPLGWRNLFTLFSAGGLLILFLYWRFGAPGPRAAATETVSAHHIAALFRTRLMWVFGAIQYVRFAVVAGLGFWLPTFIVVDKGYSLQVAGLLVALGAAVTAPSNFLGGYVSDRLRNAPLVIGTSQAMLGLTTVLLVHVHHLGLLVAVFVVNGIFIQFYFGPLFALQVDRLGSERAGLTTGCGNFFANLGGVTAVWLLGALKDATDSFTVGLYSLSGLCLFGLLCTVTLSRMKPADVTRSRV